MKNTVVVSFENQTIKVIYASSKGGAITVKDALTLNESQFEDFLRREKTKEFIVVNNFRESYQNTIYIPLVKKKYLGKIIEIEIQKKCQFRNFSYIYFLLGEKIVENRKTLEVFVFAVRNEELTSLIGRFIDKGKMVRAVYPDTFSLALMVRTEGKYALCVSGDGVDKNLFLVNDRKIVFVREAKSVETDMSDFDMRNVEMTVNYCRQTLRINPSYVYLTGNLCKNFDVSLISSVPVACFLLPQGMNADSKIRLEYITALSALLAGSDIDISPHEYRDVKFTIALLNYSTSTILFIMVLSVFYTGVIFKSAVGLRDEFKDSVRELPDIDKILTSYEMERSRTNGYRPLIASFDNSVESPNIRKLFSDFTGLKGDKIRLDSIDVTASNGVLHCRIDGITEPESYADSEVAYENFIGSFDNIKGLTITKKDFELKDRRLSVEADYR